AITVEGANILTRSLIIFGQGAIRCHPYLLEEMLAAGDPDPEAGLERFEAVIFRHLKFAFGNLLRSAARGWTLGRRAGAPAGAGASTRHFRQLSRYAAGLALTAEVALIHLGGALKRREMISARLGDVLSELYLLSCVLKRHHSEGRPEADQPIVDWCCEQGFAAIERSFDRVFSNYPSRPLAWCLRALVLPWGRRQRGADDALTRQVAELLMTPGAARERLTAGVFTGTPGDGVAKVELAFERVIAAAPLRRRLDEAGIDDADQALAQGLIDEAERQALTEAEEAVDDAVAVDHFDAATLSPSDADVDAAPERHRLSVSGRS
ncbi:MAG: DUF1974 domain-containing protein, partial [Pseudomonadales bacterium]